MAQKRYRAPKAKPHELLVQYGKAFGDLDLYFCHGGGAATSRDAKLFMMAFERDLGWGKTLRQELVERGYDITTLKLTVRHSTADASSPDGKT